MYANFGEVKRAFKSEVSTSAKYYGKKQIVDIFYIKKALKKDPFSIA